MISQVVLFACLAISTLAFPEGQHDGEGHLDYHAYPKYEFDYGVSDSKTGDKKNQWEARDGDVVKGAYSLHEADGTTRVVEYTADKHHGFNALVKRLGHAVHPHQYATIQHHEIPAHGLTGHNTGAAVYGDLPAGGQFADGSSYLNGKNIALNYGGYYH